jgi:hypothetical protein
LPSRITNNIREAAPLCQTGFIDKKGKLVIKATQYGADSFYEGLAAFIATEGDKLGFMDKTGKVVIKPQFDTSIFDGKHFSDGLVAVNYDFSEGLAVISEGGLYGYIINSLSK